MYPRSEPRWTSETIHHFKSKYCLSMRMMLSRRICHSSWMYVWPTDFTYRRFWAVVQWWSFKGIRERGGGVINAADKDLMPNGPTIMGRRSMLQMNGMDMEEIIRTYLRKMPTPPSGLFPAGMNGSASNTAWELSNQRLVTFSHVVGSTATSGKFCCSRWL